MEVSKSENWAVIAPNINPYSAPGTLSLSLQGNVFGHPRFTDGKCIITSSIVEKTEKDEVINKRGRLYELGQENHD